MLVFQKVGFSSTPKIEVPEGLGVGGLDEAAEAAETAAGEIGLGGRAMPSGCGAADGVALGAGGTTTTP